MTFTPRDVKDVSLLVAKKLELYMNKERREERFDPQGCYRTHPKMKTVDLMYQMLDATELNKKSHRRRNRSSSLKRKESKKCEGEEEAQSGSDEAESQKKSEKERRKKEKEKKKKITPVVVNNSRCVVPPNEAERLTDMANKVFEEQDLDKLHVIHRYRPNSRDVAPITENGKVANYTLHVGSALHSKNYVDYYLKEGLQSSKKEYAKRLQRLNSKKEEKSSQSKQKEKESCDDGKKGRSLDNGGEAQQIFNPLIDQSMESLLSTSFVSGNLTPIDKDKPAYQTVFNKCPSSRASSEKLSKASSQLNKARMFANGYGYRIVADSTDGYGLEDPVNRTESRAEVASSEEYCKFSSVKNNSMESGREGDGCEVKDKDIVFPSRDGLHYNKFQTTESSIVLNGLEEDDSRAKSFYNNSRPSSQRSARSHRSDSKMSHKSMNSCSVYTEGSMSVCTEESDLYESSKSDIEPDTARSISYPLSTPRRSKKAYNMQPIQTVITAPDVPRLGITSDMNDSNGGMNSSWNSCNAEDYVTAEEKAQMNTDARAPDDKKNFSQERAGDGTLLSHTDMRADRSLQQVWGNENEHQGLDDKTAKPNPQSDLIMNEMMGDNNEDIPAVEGDGEIEIQDSPSSPKADKHIESDKCMESNNPETLKTNECDLQTNNNMDNEKEESLKSEVIRLTKKANSIDFNMGTGKYSSSNNGPSDGTSSVKSNRKRAKEMEGIESERGEDKLECMELHRGQAPEADKNKLLKIKPERGDDTPRTMAAKGRLTKSAKKRGMSNYYTMGDEERGLEKEHFAPVERGVQEMYVKSEEIDDEEGPETPVSSRPSSASSKSSIMNTKDSDYDKNKKYDLEDGNKAGAQPQMEKSVDGRGDDSASIKSGSNRSAASFQQKRKESKHSDNDEAATTRASQEEYNGKLNHVESKSVDMSGGSRGSRSMHIKLGVGEGYCLEGEMLDRGHDFGVLQTSGEMKDKKENNNSDLAVSTEKSKLKDELKESITTEALNQYGNIRNKSNLSESVKYHEPAENENIDPQNLEMKPDSSREKIIEEENCKDHSLHEKICDKEDGNIKKEENVTENVEITNTENKEYLSGSKVIDKSDNANEVVTEEPEKVSIVNEKEYHKKKDDINLLDDRLEKEGTDSKMEKNVTEISKEKTAVMSYEEAIVSQDIPSDEKAFIECDLSDNDVIKEALSGSVSMFNEDNDTVIDFRPSSASTAISIGKELYTDHMKLSRPQPSKIVEVTELESIAGSARESQRSSRAAVSQEQVVPHPANQKKKRSESQAPAILNIADVKLEHTPTDKEIVHPSIRRRSLKETSFEGDKINDDDPKSMSLPGTKRDEASVKVHKKDTLGSEKNEQISDQNEPKGIDEINIINNDKNEQLESDKPHISPKEKMMKEEKEKKEEKEGEQKVEEQIKVKINDNKPVEKTDELKDAETNKRNELTNKTEELINQYAETKAVEDHEQKQRQDETDIKLKEENKENGKAITVEQEQEKTFGKEELQNQVEKNKEDVTMGRIEEKEDEVVKILAAGESNLSRKIIESEKESEKDKPITDVCNYSKENDALESKCIDNIDNQRQMKAADQESHVTSQCDKKEIVNVSAEKLLHNEVLEQAVESIQPETDTNSREIHRKSTSNKSINIENEDVVIGLSIQKEKENSSEKQFELNELKPPSEHDDKIENSTESAVIVKSESEEAKEGQPATADFEIKTVQSNVSMTNADNSQQIKINEKSLSGNNEIENGSMNGETPSEDKAKKTELKEKLSPQELPIGLKQADITQENVLKLRNSVDETEITSIPKMADPFEVENEKMPLEKDLVVKTEVTSQAVQPDKMEKDIPEKEKILSSEREVKQGAEIEEEKTQQLKDPVAETKEKENSQTKITIVEGEREKMCEEHQEVKMGLEIAQNVEDDLIETENKKATQIADPVVDKENRKTKENSVNDVVCEDAPKIENPVVEIEKVNTPLVETTEVNDPVVVLEKDIPEMENPVVETEKVNTPLVDTTEVKDPVVVLKKEQSLYIENPDEVEKEMTVQLEDSKVVKENSQESPVDKTENKKTETDKVKDPAVETEKQKIIQAENPTQVTEKERTAQAVDPEVDTAKEVTHQLVDSVADVLKEMAPQAVNVKEEAEKEKTLQVEVSVVEIEMEKTQQTVDPMVQTKQDKTPQLDDAVAETEEEKTPTVADPMVEKGDQEVFETEKNKTQEEVPNTVLQKEETMQANDTGVRVKKGATHVEDQTEEIERKQTLQSKDMVEIEKIFAVNQPVVESETEKIGLVSQPVDETENGTKPHLNSYKAEIENEIEEAKQDIENREEKIPQIKDTRIETKKETT